MGSEYMRKYLIHFMKQKNFQAISTGPFSVTFQQDISNRRCASAFSVAGGKKRIKFEYYEGDTIDPNSSTSVFFQSVLLELASQLAEKSMLFCQRVVALDPLPTTFSTIADENTFMNPAKNFWVAFLRPESQVNITKKVILRYASKSRFTVDEGSDKSVLLLSNKELYLAMKVVVGYNAKDELLVHVFYSSVPRPQIPDYDSEEEEEEEEEEDVPEVKDTGDPDLRSGDREYFHSFLLGLGCHLAEHELLRTQAEEFNKKTALGRATKPNDSPANNPDDGDKKEPVNEDEDEDEKKDEEPEDDDVKDEEKEEDNEEERLAKEAEEKKQEEERKQKEAEEQAAKEEEERKQKEEEERLAQEEAARKEAEEQAAREEQERLAKEAEEKEQAAREAEEKAAKEAEEAKAAEENAKTEDSDNIVNESEENNVTEEAREEEERLAKEAEEQAAREEAEE